MNDFSSITLAIIHWNNLDILTKQLDSIGTIPQNWEIVVVNNSPTSSLSNLKKHFSKVKWIENKFNRGFSYACNQATAASTKEWIFFLNPDVELDVQKIRKLHEFALMKKWLAISPKPQSSNYFKPLPTVWSILSEFTQLKHLIPKKLFRDKTLTGGSLLIQTETLKNLGGWDERFFLWFEDSDLTQRLADQQLPYGWANFPFDHVGGTSIFKLSESDRFSIFFHSLNTYAEKYFSNISKNIIHQITKKFGAKFLLPISSPKYISVVVPNLRHSLLVDFLKRNYLLLIEQQTEIIIVTSQLSSTKFWEIKAQFPEVRLINQDSNYGFARTTNLGFRVGSGKWLGTINDDVILDECKIQKLIQNEHFSSVNPIIMSQNQVVESIGIKIKNIGKACPILTKVKNQAHAVDATNGACVFYQHQALQSVGLFDEKFGSYLEDVDLSIRLNRAGYQNGVDPSQTVIHLKHQTSKRNSVAKSWNDCKNWWLIIYKHWKYFDLPSNILPILWERSRNLSGWLKSIIKQPKSLIKPLMIMGIIFLFLWLRFWNLDNSLLFFNDIGRDFLTLLRWQQSSIPPLLGPQTSALPYNQSAVYFYLLYPLFILTNHSAFSTIYTNIIYYLIFFAIGLFATRKNILLQKSLLICSLLISIHPQFIYQQRFVWNPSFVAPLILAGMFTLFYLKKRFQIELLFSIIFFFSLASGFSYSVAPLLISIIILLLFLYPKKIAQIIVSLFVSLSLVNFPTIFFELRHHFVLTNLLLYGEKLPQQSIAFIQKIFDLLRFSILQSTEVNMLLVFSIIALSIFYILHNKHILHSSLQITLIVFFLNLIVLLLTPISIQAHYVFGFLTLIILLISLLPFKISIFLIILWIFLYFRLSFINQYFSPAYRTFAETNQCAQMICQRERDPMFISVQSDVHPYHNGMEFKYLFAENGCQIKELDTQNSEASQMAVVVDHSNYDHGKTSYNELTQFGDSEIINQYSCMKNLEVIILERK